MKKLDARLVYKIAALVGGLSSTIVFTTSVIYRVETVGLNPLQLVLVGTTLEVTAFLFEIPTGVIADVYSRRLSSIIGVFVIGIGFTIEGIAPLFAFVLISQVVWGIGWTFISGAYEAWITDEVGVEAVGKLFLRGRQLRLTGNLTAIPISIWVANLSLAYPFFVGGGLRILLGIFLILTMPETGFKVRPKEERETWGAMLSTVRSGLHQIRGRQVLTIYVLIGLVVGLYSEGWDRLSGAHLLENFTFPRIGKLDWGSIEWFGALNVLSLLVGIAVNEIANRRIGAARSSWLTRSLQLLYGGMVIAMITFALTENFFLAIVMMLTFDTLRGLTFPLTSTWLSKHIDSEVRATVLSMTSQLDALGQFAGGPVIGWIGRLRSLRAAIVSAGLVLSPTVWFYGKAKKVDPDT
jgi:DHA3 family tetracycline resistance protein-like MFS transporter